MPGAGIARSAPMATERLIRSAIFMVEFADIRNVRQRQRARQVKPRLERISRDISNKSSRANRSKARAGGGVVSVASASKHTRILTMEDDACFPRSGTSRLRDALTRLKSSEWQIWYGGSSFVGNDQPFSHGWGTPIDRTVAIQRAHATGPVTRATIPGVCLQRSSRSDIATISMVDRYAVTRLIVRPLRQLRNYMRR
jgi:hypothetical protein